MQQLWKTGRTSVRSVLLARAGGRIGWDGQRVVGERGAVELVDLGAKFGGQVEEA